MDTIASKNQYMEKISLAKKMNELLEQYYNTTWDLKLLIEADIDEVMEKIEALLSLREDYQSEFDQIKKNYDNLKVTVSDNEIEALTKLHIARKEIINTIGKVNDEIKSKLNHFYQEHQSKVNTIQTGKRLHNAYDTHQQAAWGVYIDKKK